MENSLKAVASKTEFFRTLERCARPLPVLNEHADSSHALKSITLLSQTITCLRAR